MLTFILIITMIQPDGSRMDVLPERFASVAKCETAKRVAYESVKGSKWKLVAKCEPQKA